MSLFFQQTKTIVKKNLQFYVAKKKELFKELLVPAISALVFYVGRPSAQQQQSGQSDGEQDDGSLSVMGNMFSMMLPLYLPTTITGFAKKHLISFVQEKHERYKETQKIMGLSQRAYIAGWLITSYIMMIPICVITLISLYYSGYSNTQNSFTNIAFSFIIYLFASVHQTFAISTFFSTPKLAGEIGIFLLSATSLLYYYAAYGNQISDTSFILICLLPQTAVSFSVLSGSSQIGINYPLSSSTIMLVVDVFIYLVLYFYLDEVIPNEYGIHQSPFFIFKKKFWKELLCKSWGSNKLEYVQFEEFNEEGQRDQHQQIPNNHQQQLLIEMRNEMNQIPNEQQFVRSNSTSGLNNNQIHQSHHISLDVEELSREQSALGVPLIQITNLKKHFGKVHAVNGITLNLYKSQILCLLGHNGAGKTTTISLLTGLIEKTSGSILYFGDELESNLDKIRQQIGLCTQKDVLYDYLTVTQHLEFIASIKGYTGNQLKNEVQKIIEEVGLQNEKDKFAENLSGGNKRKLSLGMALTGGSKIIFLDEPTSGMDAVSRQQIWKILESIRNERALILTTHHLDEAERLSDRISIMSKGKILVEGNSEQIKRKYGVGYHLTITCKCTESSKQQEENKLFEQNKAMIQSLVQQAIPTSVYNQQSGKDSIKFILPFDAIDTFATAFQSIEAIPYLNINLSINSLEDAFINIGIQDEVQQPHQQQDNRSNASGFSEFYNTEKPSALFNNPSYSFFSQFKAMFLRQYYMTTRNWSAILMILLPIGFILLGVYVAKKFLTRLEEMIYPQIETGDKNQDKETQKMLEQNVIFPLKMYLFNIFIVQAYTMNTSIYINTPVLEREFQLKYALNVMGCRPLPYWLGTLGFDYLVYFMTFLIFYYSLYVSQIEFIMPHMTPLLIIMACFGFSLITFCYACGVFFSKSNTAFKYFPVIAYFISYTIPWVTLQITNAYSQKVGKLLQYIFLVISPFLTLEKALQNIDSGNGLVPTQDVVFKNNQLLNNWQEYCYVILGTSILYFIFALYMEKKFYSLSSKNNTNIPQSSQNPASVDEGVLQEIQRVNSINNSDPIKVQQIHKVFPNKFHAVKGTTFGVEKGQIFGLLGPNGAGKSTTFNIITANIKKSSGSVFLNGNEITENSSTYFDNIGVCPQNNCLWEYLKPKEHLNLFGRVKGLSGKDLNEVTEYYIKSMQLEQYKVKSVNLSGGNKRKLCVANSLIGSPSLQFFDEPSTGLDPIAKRYLWKCLKDILTQKESSIVLTTHSLQEAEDLCNKVGIQVNGEFICLNTIQNLKNQKGDGYKIYVKLNEGMMNHNEINDMIKNTYSNAKILNESDKTYSSQIIYQIPYQGFLFSQAFSLLQHNLKQNKIIEDYSITQASLEDIFIYYSQFQIAPQNENSSNQPNQ